jgi:chemotaxis protein methyltransferase CheR
MTGPDFDHFCRLVQARSGIVLSPDKAYLVQSRLEPVARAEKLMDVQALLAAVRVGAPASLVGRCIDAMATHESLFFRDTTPFEQLGATVLPALVKVRPADKPVPVWCAACSSGQEPYSLAILMQELGPLLGGRRIEITATDMSEAILAKARVGFYSDFEVRRGLTPERLARWFQARDGGWQVAPELKAMVKFARHNLLDGVGGFGPFDIVFCRNVLIYFSLECKTQILDRVAQVMAPDGALYLGSAETIIGLTDKFVMGAGARGVYRLRPSVSETPRLALRA